MLHGPIAGKLVRFAVPVAASSILQQLFNSADLAVIGNFEDAVAMAAVGSNAALVNLLVSGFGGLALGVTVQTASLIGSRQKEKISSAVHTSIAAAFISGALVCLIGEILAPVLLRLMGTPEEVLHLAVLYLRIFFCAVPFLLIYNFASSILRAKGDSTRPMIALTVSGIINVILNLVFVAVFHMGVAGVAYATLISNLISAAAVIRFLQKEAEPFRFSFRKLSISSEHLRRIILIGAPAGIQGMVFSLSNVVIQAGINIFGAAAIAGNTAAMNIEYMCYFCVFGFAQAATTFTSQNFAAGDTARCRKIYRQSMIIGILGTLGVCIAFLAARYPVIHIFSRDPEVVRYAMYRMFWICFFEFMTGTYEISGGCLRGMGHSLTPAVITMIGSCLFRLIWVATVFQVYHRIEVLLAVYLLSWIITGSATNIAYFHIRRKEFAKLERA